MRRLEPDWKIACGIFVLLVLYSLSSVALAQFAPAPGAVNTPVATSAASSGTHGGYSLTRSGVQVTVTRPDGLQDFVFQCQEIAGAQSGQSTIRWKFMNTNGLLLQCHSQTNIMGRNSLHFFDLRQASPTNEVLYFRNDPVSPGPNPTIRTNSDEMVIFTVFLLPDSAINDTFEISTWRGDTGVFLCGLPPQNRDPSDQFTAVVAATDITVTRERSSFSDIDNTCTLPVASLVVTPPSAQFGTVANNTSPTVSLTFSNPGTDSVTVNSIAATPHCSATGFSAFTLNPGDSQAVTILLNPSNPPGTVNPISESMTIDRDPPVGAAAILCEGESRDPVPTLVATPNPVAFGTVDIGMTGNQPLMIQNTGETTLNIAMIAGPGAAVFSVPAAITGAAIASGASQTFTLSYTPVAAGFQADSFDVFSDDPMSPHTIGLNGTGRVPVPILSVSPLSLPFGQVNVGASSSQTFTVSNPGQLTLNLLASTVGPSLPEFSVAPAIAGTAIAASGSQPFTVTFSPTADIPYSDSIVIDSNDPTNPTATLSLSGMGHIPAPEFVIDPTLSALDYGEVEQDYVFAKGVRVRNTGDADLTFQIEVLGDARFTVSQTPDTPGIGVRGPLGVTVLPMDEVIFRTVFQATAPIGGPYSGTLQFSNINDANVASPQSISLEGDVIAGKTLDIAMVLDRSGSMSEPTADGDKVTTLRKATTLFINLLRPTGVDQATLIQYNTQANALEPLQPIDVPTRTAFVATVQNPGNLVPSGATSIAAGLLKSFDELTDTTRGVSAVMIVSDGKENTPATLPNGNQVTLSNITVPPHIGVHSLALGRQQDVDLVRLQDIAARSGGSSNYTGDLQGLTVFDVEKFFLQVATTILGQTPVLDPIFVINPGEIQATEIPLIPADIEATFVLVFKDGVLPYRVIDPNGIEYPTGTPPAGIGQQALDLPNARILKLKLPTDNPAQYQGTWRIEVVHGGKLTMDDPERGRHSIAVKDPVPYAIAVSVASNLRLIGLVTPETKYVGDPIQLTGFMTEEGVPVTGANIDIATTMPDGNDGPSMMLYDDGSHNDGAASDGEYGGEFRHATQAGGYSFRFHAVGQSARGGTFVRETSVGKAVLDPRVEEDPDARDDDCCKRTTNWLRVIAILLVILIILNWWCCRRQYAVMRAPTATVRTQPND